MSAPDVALVDTKSVPAGVRRVEGDFGMLEGLTDRLSPAIGGSRAATDVGWIDHSAQIGQTGVTVSLQLYISRDISGAIQHKAGMQTADVIVAVNKDEGPGIRDRRLRRHRGPSRRDPEDGRAAALPQRLSAP
ncbi:FAD-binding protein [Nesterenkonia sp. K-15-9-6]|uniref:FAD-binding protein n=1 Tax=Nesterenkonia sp. K-15-9-6 TaxID=3093918 RepID=UPI0040441160